MPVHYRRTPLGQILVRNGWLSDAQLEAALESQKQGGQRLGVLLVEMGVLEPALLAQALALQRREIPEVSGAILRNLPPEVAAFIPETLAKRFNAVALGLGSDEALIVAMEDPTNLAAQDLLSHVTGRRIEVVKAPAADIATAVATLYGHSLGVSAGGSETLQTLQDLTLEVEREDLGALEEPQATDLLASAEETPVVKFVEALFRDSVQKRASDVHIEPGEQTTNVRVRVDGVLQRLLTLSSRMHPSVVSRIKILSGMNIAERRLPQDGRSRLRFGTREVDVRVSSLPTIHGEKVVMRLLDKSQGLRKLEELGFTEADLARFREALQAPYGMIILTGPTGSGKTTTLYAALTYLNEPTRNIVTVEDPVEYELPGIAQVQVKPEIGRTFARSLRHILRQDPNIIMVGEMRDLETTEIGVRAALTGHLVLSTLHANNAPGVVSRMLDIGIPAYLITASVNISIAQRLVRRLCPECKEPYEAPGELAERFGAPPGQKHTFYKATGCAACDYTGYFGRVGLYEVMALSQRLKQMVLDGQPEAELRRVAREEGMRTLGEQGRQKVLEGTTSIEEVASVPAEEGL